MASSTQEWIDELKQISVLELSERIKALEEEFGVSAAAVAAAAPAGGGGGGEATARPRRSSRRSTSSSPAPATRRSRSSRSSARRPASASRRPRRSSTRRRSPSRRASTARRPTSSRPTSRRPARASRSSSQRNVAEGTRPEPRRHSAGALGRVPAGTPLSGRAATGPHKKTNLRAIRRPAPLLKENPRPGSPSTNATVCDVDRGWAAFPPCHPVARARCGSLLRLRRQRLGGPASTTEPVSTSGLCGAPLRSRCRASPFEHRPVARSRTSTPVDVADPDASP